jgi:hypothetical protein
VHATTPAEWKVKTAELKLNGWGSDVSLSHE